MNVFRYAKRFDYALGFFLRVLDHIEDYTVPQYGDYPHDQMVDASIEEVKGNIKRYLNRIGTNARGNVETIRDCHKMAHYAAILERKLIGEMTEEEEQEMWKGIYGEETNN